MACCTRLENRSTGCTTHVGADGGVWHAGGARYPGVLSRNAGAALLHGKVEFLLAEGEWARVLLEGGPIFGLAFILFRVFLAISIGWRCLRKAATGVYLPALLFGADGLTLLSGQLGQPTSLGFAMFGGGLCLAACNDDPARQPLPRAREMQT